jgi:hypothetical protein
MSQQKHMVTFFKPYPFEKGQKIHIQSGPRKGDWLVVDCSDSQVTLRCPLSGREYKWPIFCYFIEEKETEAWPSSG